jgi:hypothetical protein
MTAAAEATLPLATVHGLFHIAIKTDNLAATRRFWTDIIGLKEFPMPAVRRWALRARRRRGPLRSIMSRSRVRAIALTFPASRRPDSTGASSSCLEPRCGNCSSTIRAVFSSN